MWNHGSRGIEVRHREQFLCFHLENKFAGVACCSCLRLDCLRAILPATSMIHSANRRCTIKTWKHRGWILVNIHREGTWKAGIFEGYIDSKGGDGTSEWGVCVWDGFPSENWAQKLSSRVTRPVWPYPTSPCFHAPPLCLPTGSFQQEWWTMFSNRSHFWVQHGREQQMNNLLPQVWSSAHSGPRLTIRLAHIPARLSPSEALWFWLSWDWVDSQKGYQGDPVVSKITMGLNMKGIWILS